MRVSSAQHGKMETPDKLALERIHTMTYKLKAKKLAAELGATIQGGHSGFSWNYNIDAPQGYTWASDTGLHCIVAFCYHGPTDWREEMWKDAIDRMEHGIEKCEEKDCETCEC